jgi:photosystem II stability/assembly factor-like uncharacterized protein
MKKLHPFISFLTAAMLLFISANTLSQNCNYNWVQQNSGIANQLTCVKAVSDMIAWTGGANAIVRRTTDGGATWVNGNPNPVVISGMVNCIDALDGNTAILTSTTGGNGFIYRTTNGGVNWTNVYTAPTVFFGLKMTDALNGFAFGDPLANVWQMLVTTDGGQSWGLSPNAPPRISNIETCLPNSFQVSLPNIWWGTSITTVYRSTNSGLNFTSHEANVTGIYILALHYNSDGTGFSASTTMSKSTNGGVNYSALPAPGAGNIEAIQGEGNNFWYIRGNGIYSSTNSGNTWEQVHTAAQSLMHMDFPDGLTGCQMGWAVGLGGGIYKLTGSVTGIEPINSNIPAEYELKQNYPNPFNPETKINFSIPKAGYTELKIYDILGNEVGRVFSGEMNAGNYSVTYSPVNIAGGVYFYTLTSGSFKHTKKMLIVK